MTASSSPKIGPPPPFDPELASVLKQINEVMPPNAIQLDTLETFRGDFPGVEMPTEEEIFELFSMEGHFTVEERLVPGPEGSPDVSLLICLPQGHSSPVGALYHIHGGGMVIGDNRTGTPYMLELAKELGIAVVSVEYRLAPETPHPGPVGDCYAGLVWTAENAEELGIDPAQIVVVGASAGGGLSAAVALLSRDRQGPTLLGQLLICPMLDDRNNSYSALQMEGVGFWDRSSNLAGWTALLGEARGSDDVSPYAAPARATDLSGLPPTFIDVGSAETFRDEDVAYANGIWQAGGIAELHVWPGGFHGFDGLAPHTALSQAAKAARLDWLRRLYQS